MISQPRNFTATEIGSRSVTLHWNVPRIPQGSIHRYEILINSSSGQRVFDIVGRGAVPDLYFYNIPNLTFTATNLTPFTNYTFEVAGVNSFGTGDSVRLTASTDQDG